jgi:dipeptidase
MYCGITGIPESYAMGNGSMITWSETSAYWTFSQLNNWAYSRYNLIHPEIERYQSQLENKFISQVKEMDQKASALYKQNAATARELITHYSVSTGNQLVSDWKVFYQYLFMKYVDGNIKNTDGHQLLENGNGKNIPKMPLQPGYGKEWERIMIQRTGERLKVPKGEK